jgi:RNA polymerase nonessential primary-like sigma factor
VGSDEGTNKTLVETIADQSVSDPEEILAISDLGDSLTRWLDELPVNQREVLMRRFGLLGHEPSTLEQVGREIGLTRERVRQIQVEALKRMRLLISRQGLDSELLLG